MAATAWSVHDIAKGIIGEGRIDFDTDTFKMILCTTGSNVNTVTTNDYGSVTNEVPNSATTGYTTAGETVTTPAWTYSGSTATFDCDDVVWTTVSADLTAAFAAIYDDTIAIAGGDPVDDAIICSCALDSGGGSVTASAGNTFTIQINASGVFTLT